MAVPNEDFSLNFIARNFRGFRKLDFSLHDVTFVVGDNSSGKTSIIYLVQHVLNHDFINNFILLGGRSRFSTVRDVLSPYINSKQVTLGLFSRKQEKKGSVDLSIRLATFKANSNNELELERITAASEGRARYIQRRNEAVLRKDESLVKRSKLQRLKEKILKEHLHPTSGYDRFNEVDGAPVLYSKLITAALIDIDAAAKQFNMRFFTLPVLANSSYGPVRLNPAHAYSLGPTQFDEKGGHTPDKLRRIYSGLSSGRNGDVIKDINQFGRESGMFDRLFVGLYRRFDPKAPFRIEIEKGGKRFSLDEVGYGVSQILPILVDSITTKRADNALISIQQPELHLHPRAQAAFGELLFKLARAGVRFLIETHSDYIIDRFRSAMFRSKVKTVSSGILFAENTKTGNVLHSIPIDSDGRISEAPANYRHFFFREQDKLFEMI